jgi:trehalose 6-phosphate phosphatase
MPRADANGNPDRQGLFLESAGAGRMEPYSIGPVSLTGRRHRLSANKHHIWKEAVIATRHTAIVSSPPSALLKGGSLLLDFDGTLVDLADRPDAVTADAKLRDLLVRLHARLDGRLAVVSGRSIAQLDAMLGPVADLVALSGSHGCEYRVQGVSSAPPRLPELDRAAEALRPYAARAPGMLVEEKSYGVALHYRMCPPAGPDAEAFARRVAGELGLAIQTGKMMIELRMPGGDKGDAVRRLMAAAPMQGGRPIFVGDDVTDEHGFESATALGGTGILVGEPRRTAASYFLSDPDAVHAWLEEAIG